MSSETEIGSGEDQDEEFNMFARKARGDRESQRKSALDAEEKHDGGMRFLTDRQFKLANAQGTLQIYQHGVVRGVATISVQEAAAISSCAIGFATSDAAVDLYDDVLEGRVDRLKAVLDAIRKVKSRVEKKVREDDVDRARAEGQGFRAGAS